MTSSLAASTLALALLTAAVAAGAQTYRTVDPSGRVLYSDRPPAGTQAASTPGVAAAASSASDLQGEWVVANVMFEGATRIDEKLVGATWSFRGGELTVETRGGKRQRYAVRPEPGAQPKAFTFVPLVPSSERGGHMIYERSGNRLRLAYLDGIDGRATGFAPVRKLAVVNLVTRSAAVGPGHASPGAGRDACAILRKAGADDLLGSAQTLATPSPSNPAATCRIEGPLGMAVVLALVPESGPVALESECAKQARDQRVSVVDEPSLGASAFSVTRATSCC